MRALAISDSRSGNVFKLGANVCKREHYEQTANKDQFPAQSNPPGFHRLFALVQYNFMPTLLWMTSPSSLGIHNGITPLGQVGQNR
jgi:hypothetical protein